MNPRKIRLFVIDESQESTCYEKCQIQVDTIAKQLTVTPSEKDVETVELNFDRTFVHQDNILGILDSSADFNNYLLFLPKSKKCKLIFNAIQKGKATNYDENGENQAKFSALLQFINYDNRNQANSSAERDLSSRKRSLRNYSNLNGNSSTAVNGNNQMDRSGENPTGQSSRKRRRPQNRSKAFTKIIKAPNFKLINDESDEKAKSKLLIFPENDKTQCYEYSWNTSNKLYNCLGCKRFTRGISARVYRNASGDIYVKLLSTKHVCELRPYNPEKFDLTKRIIKAPNFKIMDSESDEYTTSKLFIFPSSDKSECYEYTWNTSNDLYNCMGCRRLNKGISAKICQDAAGDDYVKLLSIEHVCELRPYDPEKFMFDPSRRIYDSSNYQIFDYTQKGRFKSTLVLFCPTNKNLCYEYFYNTGSQDYECGGCSRFQRVRAEIRNKNHPTEYLKLGKMEHVCNLREVDLTKFKDDLVIQKPMFEVIERVVCGVKKMFLLIFIDDGKEYCRKFGYVPSEGCFYCYSCGNQRINIRAFIIKDEKGVESVHVRDRQHICAPLKYSEVVKNNIVEASMFQLVKRKVDGKVVQHLAVFINEEKNECYEYTWSEKHKIYTCSTCRAKKVHVFAKLHETEKNGEFVGFVELCQREHKCAPKKFIPETAVKKVFEPDFKIDEYVHGGTKRIRILLFDKLDKNLCYIYYKMTKSRVYQCSACHLKHKYVTAYLRQDENGQSYIELNDTEHVCEPQKSTVLTIIRKPNYKHEKCKIDGFQRKFIIVFDQSDKSFCYKYCYLGNDKAFVCQNCKKSDVLVTARPKKDADGKEFVSLNKNSHVCRPIKYNPAEFSTIILTSNNFKLENVEETCIEIKRLIVNCTTKMVNYFIYSYSPEDDIYFCKGCNDKDVSAKLLKDSNGEDYLEMGSKGHSKSKCRTLS